MHAFKRVFVAMQDGHQVDHRVMAAHQGVEFAWFMHIGMHHRYPWKHLHAAGRQAAGGYGDAPAQTRQGFADMAAHKSGAT